MNNIFLKAMFNTVKNNLTQNISNAVFYCLNKRGKKKKQTNQKDIKRKRK